MVVNQKQQYIGVTLGTPAIQYFRPSLQKQRRRPQKMSALATGSEWEFQAETGAASSSVVLVRLAKRLHCTGIQRLGP